MKNNFNQIYKPIINIKTSLYMSNSNSNNTMASNSEHLHRKTRRKMCFVHALWSVIFMVGLLLSCSVEISASLMEQQGAPGEGGTRAGDPAPGRSPGPPERNNAGIGTLPDGHGVQEEHPTIVLTADAQSGFPAVHAQRKLPENDAGYPDGNITHLCEYEIASSDIVLLSKEQAAVKLELSHNLFLVDTELVREVNYKVSVYAPSDGSIRNFHLSTWVRSTPGGQFADNKGDVCPHAIWGTPNGGAAEDTTVFNWMISREGGLDDNDSNVTFRIRYQVSSSRAIYEVQYTFQVLRECKLHLKGSFGNISWLDLPHPRQECQIFFPEQVFPALSKAHSIPRRHGLVVELTRLNVPCSGGGFLQFSAGDYDNSRTYIPHTHSRHRHLCGKLEELSNSDRSLYFPAYAGTSLHLHQSPVFSLSYRLVDYCYNVTLTGRNDSISLTPSETLLCTFKVHLPYGNRVSLRLHVGDSNVHDSQQSNFASEDTHELDTSFSYSRRTPSDPDPYCPGLLVVIWDGPLSWTRCAQPGDPPKSVQVISKGNTITLRVVVRTDYISPQEESITDDFKSEVQITDNFLNEFSDKSDSNSVKPLSDSVISALNTLYLNFWYNADPIEEIVKQCAFGWINIRRFCVSAVEEARLPWAQAEMECARRGGHLASVRSERAQLIIDNMLMSSPGYRDHNAYWVGASDKSLEGDFRWSDGLPFTYSNWFPGWAQHNHFSKQPSDDTLSAEDCVEMRRAFHVPAGAMPSRLTHSYMWNDRDCATPNYFLCERPISDEPEEGGWSTECNRTIQLSRDAPRGVVASPAFPRQYPDNAQCLTEIFAPPGYRLLLDFEELVLENETHCSYDFLEVIEDVVNNTNPLRISRGSGERVTRRMCGDWSAKQKLLRYVSSGAKLKLRFVSDYSHHYGGFKARVSMENAAVECADDRLQMFNHSCYLFVSYPEVTWRTAQQVCHGLKAQLASIQSPEEERFITANIRNHPDYSTSAIYWLGGELNTVGRYEWTDGSDMTYSGWLPGQNPEERDVPNDSSSNPTCLGIQWMTSPTPMLPSGLYWNHQRCSHVGGYVCKRRNQISGMGMNLNRTVNGTEGRLTSPNYPGNYFHNLDYWVKIVGPERTRLVIQFSRLDLENQTECLYDYVLVKSITSRGQHDGDGVRRCGSHETEMAQFDFVSESNEALLKFHSDYSISGSGFSVTWQAVDVSGCPVQTLTAGEGIVTSPNYPHFLLAQLNCTITILAPSGKRVWLEITNYDLSEPDLIENAGNGYRTESQFSDATLEIILGGQTRPFRPFQYIGHLSDGAFLSSIDKLQIRLVTGVHPKGAGFRAVYKTVSGIAEERVIDLTNVTTGNLLHLNFPAPPPSGIDFTQNLVAPLGNVVLLEMYGVTFSNGGCGYERGSLEIHDNYADSNGTSWYLCEDIEGEDAILPPAPLAITSFLNTIHIRQRGGSIGVRLNATVRVQPDLNYKSKLIRADQDTLESCKPDPCQHGGKCISKGSRRTCQCFGHFAGMFCALTVCELDKPCLFGECQLTKTGYRCHCQPGYIGTTCDRKQRPCATNPCEGRGECMERGDSFHCRCHAWWEGQRCERKMVHIPFKPLSERMLQEPFWLGLITVFVVLGVIGLVWCAKRHFPEKIEKLLAEEADRNRGPLTSLRGSSVREQLSVGGSTAALVPPPSQAGVPRSLFGRLGIRKPSLLGLGLTSPHATATARTFSLDDLLKPLPRRTPSPRKKRNNSTPTKKNAAEKKQILQQLISPAANQTRNKVSLGELIQLSEAKTRNHLLTADGIDHDMKETTFSSGEASGSGSTSTTRQLTDPKLEKKVTFARLLNKVSAEMSSGSEIELGNVSSLHPLDSSENGRASSVPPSPSTADIRSPHSTSSNQGSDSLSSSELALSSCLQDIQINKRRSLTVDRSTKVSSADSILAMFRNFSSSTAGANLPSSIIPSPSTTPTASSPQDDAAGDDDSSTSSIHTPVSFSSGPPDSPLFYRQAHSNSNTIEVPVLDALSAHKSNASGSNMLHPPTILLEIPSSINKCLSPIHELPTPLPTPIPSPALTPIMQRGMSYQNRYMMEHIDDISDDHVSVEMPYISVSHSEDEDDVKTQDVVVDLHVEAGLSDDDTPASKTLVIPVRKNRPPPLEKSVAIKSNEEHSSDTDSLQPSPRTFNIRPHNLVIPMLTVQQPSPTRNCPPMLIFPGSPPPQRASIGETSFMFPNKQQQRKLLKEFDKPTSLDLPFAPPLITITCNMSEAESDAESISPANKNMGPNHLGPTSGNVGMCYLSPFSMCTRGDRTTSESNLSSSGYSSMASPGPSRCGSNNPLCPSEMEDPGPGPGSTSLNPQQLPTRRLSPLLKTTTTTTGAGNMDGTSGEHRGHCRGRSDSETLSDDPLLESNDEGIGTDHLDEKIEDGELKSAKELEVFICKDLVDNGKTILGLPVMSTTFLTPPIITTTCDSMEALNRIIPSTPAVCMASLQLPSIVIQPDASGCDKHHSPVSSRSESPLSDRTAGFGRFSPLFYGRNKDQLPFTDSDGLYDFPSSDCPPQNRNGSAAPVQQHRKSTGRRRERKSSRTLTTPSKSPSPTKAQLPTSLQHLLDVPGKESHIRNAAPRKPSPKRRSRTQQPVSSSSSSESLNSAREVTLRLSSSDSKTTPSPDTVRWPGDDWTEGKEVHVSAEASGEETGEEASKNRVPAKLTLPEELIRPHRKISRLRTIGNQIRFLRRLELSLKRRERLVSPSDSLDSGDDGESSPRVTSPLLQQTKHPRPEVRKMGAIPSTASSRTRISRGVKYKKPGDLLVPHEDRTVSWKLDNFHGHSD